MKLKQLKNVLLAISASICLFACGAGGQSPSNNNNNKPDNKTSKTFIVTSYGDFGPFHPNPTIKLI